MTTHQTATLLTLAAAAVGTGLAAAGPAAAGGIVVIASPSHDNACANHKTHTQPAGSTTQGSGGAGGLLAQLPLLSALNHCGGADLPGRPSGGSNVEDVDQNNTAGADNTDA